MAKVVVFGITGEEGLWFVDLEARTVSPVDTPIGDSIGFANDARANGAVIVRGLNLAVATKTREAALSGKFDT